MPNGTSAGNLQRRRRSSSTRRNPADKAEGEGLLLEPKRRGSQGDENLGMDSLAQLAIKVNALSSRGKGVTADDVTSKFTKTEQANLATICNIISGGKSGGEKKTFKNVARDEILREPSEVDKMLAGAKVITAFGRRNFDKEEIDPDDGKDEEEVPLTDNEELKFKVKAAKAKYLAMFEKKLTEEEKEQKKLAELNPDPKAYGLWDTVHSMKVLPTLMKAKKEWVPKDWDKIMEQLKEEGRDLATIDADLKEICHGQQDLGRKKTGKYLMPDDMRWCRKHARFSEKDLLKWFRRFREKCPKGVMGRKTFMELYKLAFPGADVDVVADITFEVFGAEKTDELDFKVSKRLRATQATTIVDCLIFP